MNRNRQGRDRGARSYGGGDGLLGEGPGMGAGLFEPMVNNQMNQLLLAQQLLQQQALGGAGGYGGGVGDYGMADLGGLGSVGSMHYMNQGGMGYGGSGGYQNDRKRTGGQGRDSDYKRRRRDSSGRSDRDRSRGRDNSRSGEGKDKNRSNRWDSDKDQDREEGEKGEDDYDPAEPTEDDERKDKDGNLYCHVCNVSVYDDESFRRHLNGMKHTQRMNSLLTVHQMKSNQLNSRLRAEEHLRKIEGKITSGTPDPDYYCKICNNSLTIPWERHRFSNIHKQRQLQVKRGCGWCKVHDFSNFTEVLDHRETEEHKKNADLYGKKRDDSDRSRSRSRSRDRSGKHRSHKRSSSRDRNRKNKEEEDEEDLTIPEFDAEVPVGVKYIIPVTGFFCKLCHKFYNNEKSAKGSHCQSETHYEKFKAATEEKLAAREKRLAEKAAAAEAALKEKEEAEKRKAEEKDMDEDKDENEVKTKKTKKHEDDEDYDDELPLEDEDNEGGLAKDDEYALADDDKAAESRDDTSGENYVTADSSYAYVTEDAVQAEADVPGHYQTYTDPDDKNVESYTTQEKADLDTTATDDASMDLSEASVEKEEDSVTLSDDDTAAAPVAPAKKGRGAGTARRGRARGKARK